MGAVWALQRHQATTQSGKVRALISHVPRSIIPAVLLPISSATTIARGTQCQKPPALTL